ncbi:MAG: 30S ribosomal protein S16 [Corallococcus sp.]|nr:30S ribosomal protein S16 [Corallococcus sp.]
MAVKLRLTRMGDKKAPFYRVVVIDSHKARDGQYVDLVGTFDPLREDGLKIDTEKAKKWIDCGVQPTETVKSLLVKSGVIQPSKKAAKTTKKGE